jgi:hypothetical protein
VLRAAPAPAPPNNWAGPGFTPVALLPFPFERARAKLDAVLAALPSGCDDAAQ